MEITISGKTVLIDDEDAALMVGYSWTVDRRGDVLYVRGTPKGAGAAVAKKIYLHRLIMAPPDGTLVDHIDMNGLNCTRSNMRLVTHVENNLNKRRPKNNTSGAKGCYFSKERGKWFAKVRVNGKEYKRGYFNSVSEASEAYADLVFTLIGSHARTDTDIPIGSVHA